MNANEQKLQDILSESNERFVYDEDYKDWCIASDSAGVETDNHEAGSREDAVADALEFVAAVALDNERFANA